MSRARLSDGEIDRIVGALAGWKGKLSWDLLVDRVEIILRRPFSRQGLDKNISIRTAFQQAKKRIKNKPADTSEDESNSGSSELAVALRRIDNLLAEVQTLKAEREHFLERFAVWSYNARSRGISEVELNAKLPKVNRSPSEKKR